MAQISNITLPDGTNYNLKGSIYTVIGTQTATTAAWTGVLDTVDALYDGLTIAYYLPRTSAANVTLNLTLKDETTTGAINCYYKTSTRLGTHYAAGDMVLMTYWSAGTIDINGTATTDNRWIAHAQYYNDTNTNYVPAIYIATAAKTAAKVGTLTGASWSGLTNNMYAVVDNHYDNTASAALTLNVNSHGAKPIYINGVASSSTNKTLPRGMYIVYYNGTYWDFRTDGTMPLTGIPTDRGITIVDNKIGHSNSVTAGTVGSSTATEGTSLEVPYITYDDQGHITATGTHTHTMSGFLTSSSSLDASKLTGTVPTSVLPSYVDDVLEYAAKANFPATGEEGKIYVDKTTNLTWRWGGSDYVEISPSLAIGNTASTAAAGNHTHSFTPAGSITVKTAGATNNTLKPVTAKTVVTDATFNTVVTGGNTTDIPNISKKTVVTSASGATASYSDGILTITDGSFGTGDSVTVGTAIAAYTELTTGVSGSKTTGDSVTLGTAVTVKTGDAAYDFTGTAGTTGIAS